MESNQQGETESLGERLEVVEATLIHERLSSDCADECSPDCGACEALSLIADVQAQLVPPHLVGVLLRAIVLVSTLLVGTMIFLLLAVTR